MSDITTNTAANTYRISNLFTTRISRVVRARVVAVVFENARACDPDRGPRRTIENGRVLFSSMFSAPVRHNTATRYNNTILFYNRKVHPLVCLLCIPHIIVLLPARGFFVFVQPQIGNLFQRIFMEENNTNSSRPRLAKVGKIFRDERP